MDDHMLDKIESDIKLCFYLCKYEEEKGRNYKDSLDWKAARILISAYNKLVKIYYSPENVESYSMARIDIAYKEYKEIN